MPLLIQSSFAKGEISDEMYGRVDTQMYSSALRTARNVVIRAQGGASSRPGLVWAAPVKDHTYDPRLIKFEFSTLDTYVLEFGDAYMRVIRNGGHILEAAVTITGITNANPAVVTAAGHGYATGDEAEILGVAGLLRGVLNGVNQRRFKLTVIDANTFSLNDQVTGLGIDTSTWTAYTSGGTVSRVYTIVSPFAIADMLSVEVTQSADVMTLTHKNYAPQKLSRTGDTSWAFTTPTFAPSIAAPTGLSGTANATGSVNTDYAVTASATGTLEESLPATCTVTGAQPYVGGTAAKDDTLTWTAVADAQIYSVYESINGLMVRIGQTQATTFENTNLAGNFDITPPSANDPFVGAGNYPATVGYYKERLVYGGTINAPDTSVYSQVASENNLTAASPPGDSDAITVSLISQQVNGIVHYLPCNTDLIVFTTGSEWQINQGAGTDFSDQTISQNPQSSWGCSYLPPILVNRTILFVPPTLATVRSLGFTWQINGYTGEDLAILSNHLFSPLKTIVDWTYAKYPDPVVHAVRSDGQLCALTYNQEQTMTAWTRWDTQGSFTRTVSLPAAALSIDETVYFVVKRRINGQTVRYIEYTHDERFTDVRDCFFVDAGISYDNPVAITGVSLANPCVVTAPGHGLTTGALVDIFDIVWTGVYDAMNNYNLPGDVDTNQVVLVPPQLNTSRFIATVIDDNTFSIATTKGVAVDSTNFLPYVEGGTVRQTANIIEGLDHLEGALVTALVDGNVVRNLTVTNGAITLPRPFSRVHVGLNFIADVETLNVEAPGSGTIQGEMKKISRATIRFKQSRGLWIGKDQFSLVEAKWREFENMGDPTALFTGDKLIDQFPSWNTNGRLFLRQPDPLPMTVLAIIPDIQVGT